MGIRAGGIVEELFTHFVLPTAPRRSEAARRPGPQVARKTPAEDREIGIEHMRQGVSVAQDHV